MIHFLHYIFWLRLITEVKKLRENLDIIKEFEVAWLACCPVHSCCEVCRTQPSFGPMVANDSIKSSLLMSYTLDKLQLSFCVRARWRYTRQEIKSLLYVE